MTEQEWTDFKAKIAGHTDGPWVETFAAVAAYGSCDTYSGAVLVPIAHAYRFDEMTDCDGRVFSVSGDPNANAALIAAAPTLVAEVERLREALTEIAARKWDSMTDGCNAAVEAKDIARTALTGSPQ